MSRAALHARVRTRQGTDLATDVFLPEAAAEDALTFLLRTPYGRHGAFDAVPQVAELITGLGHVLVSQDVRGKFDSTGRCRPFAQELADGADTLDWIDQQDWSAGRVVPTGESYCGFTALAAAATGHPSVVAVLAGMTTSQVVSDWLTSGGVFRLHLNAEWITMTFGGPALPARLPWTIDNWWEVSDVEEVDTGAADLTALRDLRRVSESAGGDAELAGGLVDRMSAVAGVPVVLWTGFWDPLARGTIAEFRAAVAARPHQLHHLEIASTDHVHNPWQAALTGESAQRDRAHALVECYRRNLVHLQAALDGGRGNPTPAGAVTFEDQERGAQVSSQWPPPLCAATIAVFAQEVSVPAPTSFSRLPDSGETFVWGSLASGYPDERSTVGHPGVVALPFEAPVVVGDLILETSVRGSASQIVATVAREVPDGRLLRVAEGALRLDPAAQSAQIRLDLGPICHRYLPSAMEGDTQRSGHAGRWWLLLSQEHYPRYLPASQAHAWVDAAPASRPRDGCRAVLLRGLTLRTVGPNDQ